MLFVPGESFLSAALEGDANLLELAAEKNIILATPMLCIALLKTIAQGWRQDLFSQKTHRIIAMSQDLSVRLEKFQDHLLGVGKALKNSHLAYQSALGLFQDTIVPTVEKLGSIVPDTDAPDADIITQMTALTELTEAALENPHEAGLACENQDGQGDMDIEQQDIEADLEASVKADDSQQKDGQGDMGTEQQDDGQDTEELDAGTDLYDEQATIHGMPFNSHHHRATA